MTLHPLGYHDLVAQNNELRRGFWFAVLDDRARGVALTRIPPAPPAILCRVGASLIPWRPSHG